MKKLEFPKYLMPMAEPNTVAQGDTYARAILRCPCGCRQFRMERTVFTQEEQEKIDAYREYVQESPIESPAGYSYAGQEDENGVERVMRRRPWGDWEPVEPHKIIPPVYRHVSAVRVICETCGAQTLLFDTRLHGRRDELAFTEEAMTWAPHWAPVEIPERTEQIYVEVRNEERVHGFRLSGAEPPVIFREIAVWGQSARGESDLLFRADTY